MATPRHTSPASGTNSGAPHVSLSSRKSFSPAVVGRYHSTPPTKSQMSPPWSCYETLVLKAAASSRLLLFALIVLWRSLVNPYDTSATLNPDCLAIPHPSLETFVLWPSLGSAIESSVVWDGVYYVRIAQCGYEYEQTYAFFPLLPVLISSLSRTVLRPLVPVIGYRAVLVLSGYLINNFAFVFAALYFYRLSVSILKDPKASLRASILFCFNPASIFYTSIYSESLYALFSIGGVYHLFSGAHNRAVLWLALSGFVRSNGMLNAGYICFHTIIRAYEALVLKRHANLAMQTFIAGMLRSLFIFLPFISFQAFGYYNLCHGLHLEDLRPWCRGRIPTMYNYIQGHYWGVGFFKYFHLKQLPNFLLASPILTIMLCSIITYAKAWLKPLFSVGFRAYVEEMSAEVLFLLAANSKAKTCSSNSMVFTDKETRNLGRRNQMIGGAKPSTQLKECKSPDKPPYTSALILPFIVHLGFMGATAFFVMHVQVATRFLSANPPVYWFASHLMVSPGSSWRWGHAIWAYSAAYILLGSLLFPNFYPFT